MSTSIDIATIRKRLAATNEDDVVVICIVWGNAGVNVSITGFLELQVIDRVAIFDGTTPPLRWTRWFAHHEYKVAHRGTKFQIICGYTCLSIKSPSCSRGRFSEVWVTWSKISRGEGYMVPPTGRQSSLPSFSCTVG